MQRVFLLNNIEYKRQLLRKVTKSIELLQYSCLNYLILIIYNFL
jgi:hypothetical protein